MAKIISASYLNKKLTGDLLKHKVGSVKINNAGVVKTLAGVGLKKFIANKLSGKTLTLIEKKLKDEYGVSGYQSKKRKALINFITGNQKKGLTEEQIKKNLQLAKRQTADIPEPLEKPKRIRYAADKALTGGISAKVISADLNIKEGAVGFTQKYKKTLPDNQAPKTPLTGIRPLGL